MSVLIKGMQMPHDCFECPLSIPPISDHSPYWMCGANAMSVHEADTEEHRPYGCPLVDANGTEYYVEGLNALYGGEEEEEPDPRYCDRNICMENEYNGIECGECEVTKHNEKIGKVEE